MVDWILVFCQLTSRPKGRLRHSVHPRPVEEPPAFRQEERRHQHVEIRKNLCAQRRPKKASVDYTMKNPVNWEMKQ